MKTTTAVPISFEFFPPKTEEGKAQLEQVALTLANYQPRFFSVTFGAGGSTRDGTIETVKKLQDATKRMVCPHLACVGAEREELVGILKIYHSMGVKRIVTLRGDLPEGGTLSGEFIYASDLVALIRDTLGNDVEITVAAYPEIHPQAISLQDDILNLKRKRDAGANNAITQYFFNADAFFYYRDECAAQGIDLPIIPGIMPITQYDKLIRFSKMCGAEVPLWLSKRLAALQDDPIATRQFSNEIVGALCERLLKGGAPGLHFYTLNRTEATIPLLQQLGIGTAVTPIQKQAV